MLFRHQIAGLAVDAPAKLNLFLKVLGRRSDGYHDLETLMVSVGLYDTLRLMPAADESISLACVDAAGHKAPPQRSALPPVDSSNLVMRAAVLLREYSGVRAGARLELYKRIPMAAGLGGGSSDAAATLAGLNRLWNLALSQEELQRLAARLGSDVAFFLSPATAAICRGRGEFVEPLVIRQRLYVVIVRPPTGLSTAEVYRHCRPSLETGGAGRLVDALRRGRLDLATRSLHNTLQEPAERLNPEITLLRTWFSRQPFAGHLMSGSGSSYFGLCRSQTEALRLAARLRHSRSGEVFVASNRP